jgi:putative nucleotidyltransferase with HDIG domain
MRNGSKILIVDDEAGVLDVIQALFTSRGYECRVAASAREGVAALREFPAHAVLTDIDMPEMNGLELTRRIVQANPYTSVILMTGNSDVALAIEALRSGASDYLLKPFDFKTAEAAIERSISRKLSIRHKDDEISELRQRIIDAMNNTLTIGTRTMETFCRTLEMRDIETFSHVERVSKYACRLAKQMGLEPMLMNHVRVGSLLHDVGKVMVPDRILFKEGPLTPDEWAIMRKHVEAGYRIVSGIPGLEQAAEIVLQHHEHWNGGGYPSGIKGEEICIGARVFTVADTYDAMTNLRPYRGQGSDDAARAEILSQAGHQFDPAVVRAFLEIPKEEWRRVAVSDAIEPSALANTLAFAAV